MRNWGVAGRSVQTVDACVTECSGRGYVRDVSGTGRSVQGEDACVTGVIRGV